MAGKKIAKQAINKETGEQRFLRESIFNEHPLRAVQLLGIIGVAALLVSLILLFFVFK